MPASTRESRQPVQPARSSASRQVALTAPLIVLLLAFTAVPVELTVPPAISAWPGFDARFDPYDVAVNVVGYAPLGAALAASGAWPALGAAAVVSSVAELSQLASSGRTSSPVDALANVLGALLGWLAARRLSAPAPLILVTGRRAVLALALAAGLLPLAARVSPLDVEKWVNAFSKSLTIAFLPVSDRGSALPGRLEALWTFELDDGAPHTAPPFVADASGNGVSGTLVHAPGLGAGISGRALLLNGRDQYANFGRSTSLRLTGSMTVSALINASSFPASDAVILSSYGGLGYQLDTTADQGVRTVGFRITDRWGRLTSRYGRTPLETNAWYHIAGVLDTQARTLSVYLNGGLDNGCLAGTVTSKQTVSPGNVYVGRAAWPDGFEFAGMVDDVRVYSRALSPLEVREVSAAAGLLPVAGRAQESPGRDDACTPEGPVDARTPGLIVAIGLLAAVAGVGLWPTPHYRLAALMLSAVAGFILALLASAQPPGWNSWLTPLLTTLGGLAVLTSTRVLPQAGPDETRR